MNVLVEKLLVQIYLDAIVSLFVTTVLYSLVKSQ